MSTRCTAKTAKGERCKNAPMHGTKLCGTHTKSTNPGRPSEYRPEMLDKVLLSAVDGATWQAIGEACDIDPRTAERWCDADETCYNEEFRRAVTRAKAKADEAVLTSHFHTAIGFDYTEDVAVPGLGLLKATKRKHGETAAQKSWLANRIGWVGEKSTSEVTMNGRVSVAPEAPEEELLAEAEAILRAAAARRASAIGADHGAAEDLE
jgi:hypothetical protein